MTKVDDQVLREIDDYITKHYPEKPAWLDGPMAARNRCIVAEYNRLMRTCKLSSQGAMLVLARLSNRSMETIRGIIYR